MPTIKYDDHIYFFLAHRYYFHHITFLSTQYNIILIIIERHYLVNVYLMLYDELDDYLACVCKLVLLDNIKKKKKSLKLSFLIEWT